MIILVIFFFFFWRCFDRDPNWYDKMIFFFILEVFLELFFWADDVEDQWLGHFS